jgi:hypothetical protein
MPNWNEVGRNRDGLMIDGKNVSEREFMSRVIKPDFPGTFKFWEELVSNAKNADHPLLKEFWNKEASLLTTADEEIDAAYKKEVKDSFSKINNTVQLIIRYKDDPALVKVLEEHVTFVTMLEDGFSMVGPVTTF